MPKKLQKHLQDYLITKMKKPPPLSIQFPSSKKWMRTCKHPRTTTTHQDKDDDDAATLSDVDEFLFENFRSLYLRDDEDDHHHHQERRREENSKEGHRCIIDHIDERRSTKEEEEEPFWDKPLPLHMKTENDDRFLFESPRLNNIDPPAAADLCGSHRFSVSPGRLSSSVRTSTTTATTSEDYYSASTPTSSHSHNKKQEQVALPSNCISVLMHSSDPGEEFRRSMHDMVEARRRNVNNKAADDVVDWNFMEELLFCYLNLNEKKSHRFILSAFADLVVDMRSRITLSNSR